MELIPAIDIIEGRCVRLYQGDYQQSTVFDPDPIAVARRWAELGATRLHVVDLDGAKAGRPINAQIVFGIVRAVNIPVQLGGGLRDQAAVDAALNIGVDRIILGTAALADPNLLHQMIQQYADRIVVSVDARGGLVATNGWLATSTIRATDFVRNLLPPGVQHVIYTDITRDGTLRGPNISTTAEMVSIGGPAVIAAGGVGTVTDLVALASIGVAATVIGKALYTGAINLQTALHTVAALHPKEQAV